ncbi:unnamed protein product [Arctogadus glacialis]
MVRLIGREGLGFQTDPRGGLPAVDENSKVWEGSEETPVRALEGLEETLSGSWRARRRPCQGPGGLGGDPVRALEGLEETLSGSCRARRRPCQGPGGLGGDPVRVLEGSEETLSGSWRARRRCLCGRCLDQRFIVLQTRRLTGEGRKLPTDLQTECVSVC